MVNTDLQERKVEVADVLLHYILEFSGSHLTPHIDYHERLICCFTQLMQVNARVLPQTRP